MYRRYQATPSGNNGHKKVNPPVKNDRHCPPDKTEEKKQNAESNDSLNNTNFFAKLLPQSLYNPQTGKVFGILSTDDLFLLALIILIIDNGDECEDNSMLVYALLYILISEHIDLPF